MKLHRLLVVPALAGALFGAAAIAAPAIVSADEYTQMQRSVCINGECTKHDSGETGADARMTAASEGRNLRQRTPNGRLTRRQAMQQERLQARASRLRDQMGRLQALSAKGGEYGSNYGDRKNDGKGDFNLNILVGNQHVDQECSPTTTQSNSLTSNFNQRVKVKPRAKWLKEVEVNTPGAQAFNANQTNQNQTTCQQNTSGSQAAFGILSAIEQAQDVTNVNSASQTQENEATSAAAVAAAADSENSGSAAAAAQGD